MYRVFIKALFMDGMETMMENYTMKDITKNKWKDVINRMDKHIL